MSLHLWHLLSPYHFFKMVSPAGQSVPLFVQIGMAIKDAVVVLLAGGDTRSQDRDILTALDLARTL